MSKSKKSVAPVASAPVVAPAPVAPVATATKKEESAETKWARRLKRWAGKVETAGLDPKKLMQDYLAA